MRIRHLAALLPLIAGPALAPAGAQPLRYTVSLADRAGHTFAVTLDVDSLPAASTGGGIFQFAATAPGTYQVMDVGRFVGRFEALDAAGKPLGVERLSTNQWRVADPRRVRRIRYAIKATRDTTVAEHPIYEMCGSALRATYAMINGQAVFGFPKGMQSAPLSVRVTGHPAAWTVATSLRSAAGRYRADDYDHLVDSPFLLGRLTTASVAVGDVPVRIAVHSKSGRITAPQLAGSMTSMLRAAGRFLGTLPVDRYTFLFDFGDVDAGAWEHSFSSEYVLKDTTFSPDIGARTTDIAAHEFFHVVTPLNIHSEIVEHFNFETPVPSRHLWLYEGTTEWAAHKMQLEAGLKTPEQYLASIVQKSRADHRAYDTTYSLTKLALTSYSDSGQRQYGNIYQRGAIVAALLDVELLDESSGERGLRELVNDLARTYGKKRAFPEDSLFDVIAKRTSPRVGAFFRRYVIGAEHPPLREGYAKLGVTLVEDDRGLPVRFTIDPNPTPAQRRLREAWLGRRRAPSS
jgi:predicted metalloprotease with PDZ domain